MDLVMNKTMFDELTCMEMETVDGGASVGAAVAGAIGVAAIAWAAPVAIVVGSGALGVGMAVAGAGAVINMVS